jgi:hypothetical protein
MSVRRALEFTTPNLILCEGPEDVSFFRALVEERQLPHANIRDTRGSDGAGGGNSKFGRALRAFRTMPSYRLIRKILVVGDADADPAATRQSNISQIMDATGVQLDGALLPKATGDNREIAYMEIPIGGSVGNLEVYCQEAARSSDEYTASFVDNYISHLPKIGRWSRPIKTDELWLRTYISASCIDRAFVTTAQIFSDHLEIIPVSHKSFDPVAKFIDDFFTN